MTDKKLHFTDSEVERYLRHIDLEGVGPEGQRRLKAGRVLVVGAGGLGSPALLYLAAAGVGTIGIVDGDHVSLSNLQRQVIHSTAALGELKTQSAKRRLLDLNPEINVVTYDHFLTPDDAAQIIADYDFVLEATDNFDSKYLICDTCTSLAKPYSIGGVQHFSGQTITCLPGTASYRDVFPEAPRQQDCDTCQTAGILGVVPGILGTIQAAEAIKYLISLGDLLTDRLLTFDSKTMSFYQLELR